MSSKVSEYITMLKHSRVARHAYASRVDKMGFSKYIKIVISSHILLDSTEQKVKGERQSSAQPVQRLCGSVQWHMRGCL
jgi:hypothetical protein